MILLFSDNDRLMRTFEQSSKITMHKLPNITIKKLMTNTDIQRKIENLIKTHHLIDCIIFYFGYGTVSANEISQYHLKKYIEWIVNLHGKFKRVIVLPPPIHPTSRLSILDHIKYYETTYMFTKYINEYKLGSTLVAININRHLLDSNLLPRIQNSDNTIYNAIAAELKTHNIEI